MNHDSEKHTVTNDRAADAMDSRTIVDKSDFAIESDEGSLWGKPEGKPEQSVLKEPEAAAYGRERDYHTVEEYLALPEGTRVELIDGVFYDMAAPDWRHQLIIGEVYGQVRDYIKRKGGNCCPLLSPSDVQLDRDDRTMLQPDLMIVCKKEMLIKGRIFGAPDFIMEVLSPSTRSRDLRLKKEKYMRAGVRECWYIDPKQKRVLVFDMEHGKEAMYGFNDLIPVTIYGGDLKIDMTAVQALLDEWGV